MEEGKEEKEKWKRIQTKERNRPERKYTQVNFGKVMAKTREERSVREPRK